MSAVMLHSVDVRYNPLLLCTIDKPHRVNTNTRIHMSALSEAKPPTPPVVVAASGYFDPIHPGHLEYLERAKALGDVLVVIVNSDAQKRMKSAAGPFMDEASRRRIVEALRCVDRAVIAIDEDRSVCETLRRLHPDVFTNGGDQFNQHIPEAAVCEELGIRLVDGLGEKIQSSSALVAACARRS